MFPLDINLEGELLDHTVVLYSAIKKGNFVIVTTWIKLDGIILSGINQGKTNTV